MWMFSITHLRNITKYTNYQLAVNGMKLTISSEILTFFGILVLLTRFEFGSRRALWSTRRRNKYIQAPDLAQVMSRHRFDSIRSCLRFSSCPFNNRHDLNRWNLVDGFVTAINDHRANFVSPSDLISVDECMSRWYGLG